MKKITAIVAASLCMLFALSVVNLAKAELIEREIVLDFPNDKLPDVVEGWIGVSLASGLQVASPARSAPSWDIRVKQMYAGTNEGVRVLEVALARGENFSSVKIAPNDLTKYSFDEYVKPPGPTKDRTFYSEVLSNWCGYRFSDHGCNPKMRKVFIVSLKDGRFAKVQMTRYVKNGYDGENDDPKYGKDNQVHVAVHYKLNTVPGDLALE